MLLRGDNITWEERSKQKPTEIETWSYLKNVVEEN